MSGTKEGGQKAAETNRKRYSKDFYKQIGTVGGKNSRHGGWYGNSEAAREAGIKGGKASRRRTHDSLQAD